jgi:hypothetical protein
MDGYNLLPNGCILATCLQSNSQIPSSWFARAFFLLLGFEISPKENTDSNISYNGEIQK